MKNVMTKELRLIEVEVINTHTIKECIKAYNNNPVKTGQIIDEYA